MSTLIRDGWWNLSRKVNDTSREKIIEAIENTLQLNVRGIIYSGTDMKRDRRNGDQAAPLKPKESV